MFYLLFPLASLRAMTAGAVIFAGLLTLVALGCLKDRLPKDGGREFAVNGAKSIGKPRGAGLILIFVFVISALLFLPASPELLIYLVLAFVEMLSGYFDDASDKPWGRLVKGLLDFGVALVCALTWLANNPSTFRIAVTGATVTIPRPVYACLIILLIWASINVVNCSDGVDGLCASLSAVTLFCVFLIAQQLNQDSTYSRFVLILIVVILAYLWFNSSPSVLLMGDAGSRSIGFLIALSFLKLGYPLLFIPLTILMILDGGLGLVKITLIKVTHRNPLGRVRTPIHDHFRKNKGWSDTQVVARFTVLQALIGLAVICAFF
ncbi:MAG: phospho-N-acetylmuramoyl-pentapeptide-transferase [Lachnospira sp.]|nr:phospho-N-acetylmuramoyl-pentapeptide-transferase [Lachnospira sp.]